MSSVKDSYTHLLSLTQLFLLREHSLKEMKRVDPTVLTFFQTNMKSASPLPSTKETPRLPPTPMPFAQNAKITTPTNPTSAPIPPSPNLQPSQTSKAHLASQPPQQPPQPNPEPIPPEPLPPSTQPEPTPPPPQAPVIQDKAGKAKGFSLDPMTAASSRDQSEWWKLAKALFPDWTLSEAIPNDSIAQKNKNIWLKNQEIPSVIILSFHDNEQHLTFLKNIAQAISLRLAPARVLSAPQLEKENCWKEVLGSSHLRLVIASDYGLYLQPKLMQFYREVPQQSKHFLNQTPLLLLSDIALYLKEPQLKPLLWRAICNEFATTQLK